MRRVDSNDVTWSDVEVVLSGTRTEHRYLTQTGIGTVTEIQVGELLGYRIAVQLISYKGQP